MEKPYKNSKKLMKLKKNKTRKKYLRSIDRMRSCIGSM
jgi:hypothetical protein